MRFHSKIELCVAGTGSSGNAYVINTKGVSILLDAGVKYKKILPLITGKQKILFLSHDHGDHAKYVQDYIKHGFDFVFGNDYRSYSVNAKSIELSHDIICYGYYIAVNGHYFVYITDTSEIRFLFRRVDTLIIEANYDDEMIEEQFIVDKINPYLFNRIRYTHLSFQQVCNFVTEQEKVYPLANVICIHLSDSRADEKKLLKMLKTVTAANIFIAKNGESYTLEF